MVDVSARLEAAALLRRARIGQLTNYEIDDCWPISGSDRALAAIKDRLWCFYDDFPEKPLSRDSFNEDQWQIIERCDSFLRSGDEYEWPPYSFSTEERSVLGKLLGLGKRRAALAWQAFCSSGDIRAWPFIRCSDAQHHSVKEKNQP